MQDFIKQQNTFTTIAAANAEVIGVVLTVGVHRVVDGCSSQTQAYRGV